MEIILSLIVCLFIFALFAYNADANFWQPKSMILRFATLMLVWWELYQILPMGSFLIAYAIGSAMFCVSHELIDHFIVEKGKKNHQWQNVVTQQLLDIYSLALLLILVPTRIVDAFFQVLPIIAIVGLVLSIFPINVFVFRVQKAGKKWGLGGNPSINSTLMSIVAIGCLSNPYPYISIIGFLAGFAATFVTKGSAGVGGLLFGATIYGIYKAPLVTLSIYGTLLLTIPLWWKLSYRLFPAAYPLKVFGINMHPFFSMSNRDKLWRFAWNELWVKYCNKLFGCGYATASHAMPVLQIALKEEYYTKAKEVLTAMHSDLLQWLFEGGYVGIILLIFSIAEMIFIGHGDAAFMAMLGCFAVNATANYPVRLAPDSVTFVMCLKRIL